MKKFLHVCALIVALVLSAVSVTSCGYMPTVDNIKAKGKLVMLTNAAFPPYEYTDGDSIVGIDVDIANEIASDLGVTLDIQNMEFEGIISAIASGKGDIGVAGMSITDERKKSVDFSIEYVSSKLVILVQSTNTEITGPDALKNKNISVQTGTTSDVYASEVEGASVQRFNSFLDAATALVNGQVDAEVVDEQTATEILAAQPTLMELSEPLAEENYAIAVKKGNTTLLDAVNKTLERLLDEGKISEFTAAHASSATGADTSADTSSAS